MEKPPRLTYDRRIYLLGLNAILETLPASGAYIHALRQRITVIRLCLQLDHDLPVGEEERCKRLIRLDLQIREIKVDD